MEVFFGLDIYLATPVDFHADALVHEHLNVGKLGRAGHLSSLYRNVLLINVYKILEESNSTLSHTISER